MSNPFDGLVRKVRSIEIGGKTFYFKPMTMAQVYELQQIKDGQEIASQTILMTICDEDAKPLKGFKPEHLKSLTLPELMSMVKFAQRSGISAEKKS